MVWAKASCRLTLSILEMAFDSTTQQLQQPQLQIMRRDPGASDVAGSGLLPPFWTVPTTWDQPGWMFDMLQATPPSFGNLAPTLDFFLPYPFPGPPPALDLGPLSAYPSSEIYDFHQTPLDFPWTVLSTDERSSILAASHDPIPGAGSIQDSAIDLSFLSEQERFIVDRRLINIKWKAIQSEFKPRWGCISVSGLVMRLGRLRKKYKTIAYILPAKPRRGPRKSNTIKALGSAGRI